MNGSDGHGMEDTLDLEARAHSEHPEALRLWLRLLTCTTTIEQTIAQRLRDAMVAAAMITARSRSAAPRTSGAPASTTARRSSAAT